MRETLQHKALQLTGPQFPSAASVPRCSKSALELSLPGRGGPPLTEFTSLLGLRVTRGLSPLHSGASERGGKAWLQEAAAAAPPFCASGSSPGPRAQDGCGAASQESNGEIRYRSHPPRRGTPRPFLISPHPLTGKKKKRSWRMRGTYPTGGLPRTRGVVLQALRRPGSLLTSGSRHPGGVGPEA